ncbi:hypothetical protein QWY14_10515 [Planococcus sp. N028]|uniref:Lycopene cyclase domain-containing protein n=1 Tax=Planococcus shixiaomingii TaxID=3058393 RepID=A0ABT8N2W3_9BACL|nr:hypothetical protein [Planococcus sp. N028]MDN7242234.1 hypothetical protein [Planococcus sp. N028]
MPLIDPFLMQLVIVPLVVIGLGLIVAIRSKKVIVKVIASPLVTLVLNMLYEIWYSFSFNPNLGISFSSWNIYLPLLTFALSWLVVLKDMPDEPKGTN